MDNNRNNTTEILEDSGYSIKEFLKLCLSKWVWFAVCVIVSVGISLFYIYTRQPKYERYEQILVADQNSNDGLDGLSNAFSSLGLFSKNTNVYNELITMTSPAIMYAVADTLQLYMNYLERDGLREKTLYGKTLPWRIDLPDIDTQEGASFKMKVYPNGEMEFFKFRRPTPDGVIKYKEKITVKGGTTEFDSPIGKILITPNPKYVDLKREEVRELNVSKMPLQMTVEDYCEKLKGDLVDQDADVIELLIRDVSVERAVDILNDILIVYNQNWINDKNKMAVATSSFIDDRLKEIQAELGNVDENIARYMKQTGVPDYRSVIQANLELGSKVEEDLITTGNQLGMAKFMQQFLSENDNINTVIPVNIGIGGEQYSRQVLTYNDILIERNRLQNISSASNPLVQNYDRQLEDLRVAILNSVNNQVSVLQKAMDNLKKEIASKTSELANAPEENLPLLSEQRQRSVKEALYLYLLQKKEENELTQKFSADNIRVITPPLGSLKPVSPKKALIIIIALILGFGIPFTLIYFLEILNTTIRDKKDLEGLRMPFAGEIPQVGKKSNLRLLKEKNPLKRQSEETPPARVVEAGKRDVANEAFRVVRGNLDFMAGKNKDRQVIMITSFNPGSGKSFVTYNLALAFTLKNKKVLIIDCDLRHGSASMIAGKPEKGLTDYLSGVNSDWRNLVINMPHTPGLSVLPVGKIPPNPAELLENGKMEKLVSEAKEEYDIVFLDCPPVNIVVDTQIVAPLADRTIFIVRAGLLERTALKELNEFYEEKKFRNLSVILNGTEAAYSRYYSYGNYQSLN